MSEQNIQFSVKPIVTRAVLPHALLLLFLGVLLFVGLVLNMKLLNIELSALYTVIICFVIITLLSVQVILKTKKVAGIRYDFYVDRIVIIDSKTQKVQRYVMYVQIPSAVVKSTFFDRFFDTSSLKLNDSTVVEYIKNAENIGEYIKKMISYYRSVEMQKPIS